MINVSELNYPDDILESLVQLSGDKKECGEAIEALNYLRTVAMNELNDDSFRALYKLLSDICEENPPARKNNTRIEYLYRDCDNYKTWNEVVLSGKMTENQFKQLRTCCEDGDEMFIPEEVNLPLIRGWDPDERDHPYAELTGFETTEKDPTVDLTVEQLVLAFEQRKGKWNSLAI